MRPPAGDPAGPEQRSFNEAIEAADSRVMSVANYVEVPIGGRLLEHVEREGLELFRRSSSQGPHT